MITVNDCNITINHFEKAIDRFRLLIRDAKPGRGKKMCRIISIQYFQMRIRHYHEVKRLLQKTNNR